ncbi:hypothetical protein QQ045_007112 [Rhodiola kirilowii]
MVFGDTVVIAMMEARKLTREDKAANHPAGRIVRASFSRSDFYFKINFVLSIYVVEEVLPVKDLMKKKEELLVCKEGDLIMDQLMVLTSKGCGCLLLIDDEYHLIGTFTDGDLRRTLKASKRRHFQTHCQ